MRPAVKDTSTHHILGDAHSKDGVSLEHRIVRRPVVLEASGIVEIYLIVPTLARCTYFRRGTLAGSEVRGEVTVIGEEKRRRSKEAE